MHCAVPILTINRVRELLSDPENKLGADGSYTLIMAIVVATVGHKKPKLLSATIRDDVGGRPGIKPELCWRQRTQFFGVKAP
jgi:hypothetical protein